MTDKNPYKMDLVIMPSELTEQGKLTTRINGVVAHEYPNYKIEEEEEE